MESSFLNDLDIPFNIGGNGIVVRTAPGTFTNRTIIGSTTHAGGAGFAALEGISIGRGDGVAGNPEIGLDILGLTAVGRDMIATDLFVMYDGTNNLSITGQQIANFVAAGSPSYGQIACDTTTVTAVASGELVTFAGTGITTTGTESGVAGSDVVTFTLDISDLPAGAGTVDLTDSIGVNEAGTTSEYTLQDMVDDLDIPNAITTNGFVVRDAADSYVSRSIAIEGVGALDGLSISDGDGVAGNPTLGLDINGLPAAGEDLAAGDELAVYNLDAPTANESMTGQEIADGVVNIIFGINTNITITNINGEPTLVFNDNSRGGKTLSVAETPITWSESLLSNNDWLNIGSAVDSLSGYVVPHNATIVKATMHCENDNTNTKTIDLWINQPPAVALTATLFTTPATGADIKLTNVGLNIDVTAGDKIQLRAGPTGGNIQDTVVTLWLKWRV